MSDSDSDEGESSAKPSLSAAYKALDINSAIRKPTLYCAAVAELEAILSSIWTKKVDKGILRLIEADVQAAIIACDGTERSWRALHLLMLAVERRGFPQAKRQALVREYKLTRIATCRTARRARSHVTRCSNRSALDPAGPPSFADLPRECLIFVFNHLDPLSLAAAVCTCRTWKAVGSSNTFWQPLLDLTFGRLEGENISTIGGKDYGRAFYTAFSSLAYRHSAWLLPWKSPRITCHGSVRWVSQPTWERLLRKPGPAGIARSRFHGITFLTPEEVALWLDTRSPKVLAHFVGSWGERENERLRLRAQRTEEEDTERDRHRSEDQCTLMKSRFWALQYS